LPDLPPTPDNPIEPPPPDANGHTGTLAPIPHLNIEDELESSYLTYAMSVLVSRALPDVRDGLKPSQRRILVAMNDLGLGPTSTTSKCAGIIGETMKRYHPHGDASIYGSLVRMAQDWVLRYKLIHGQGNFGSVAGLPPAAHRYTEARLTHFAAEMLADLDHETVDFIDNYDGKYREPLVLPAKAPNLLVNGSDGIAVGLTTDIPPHNLREVCDGILHLLDNPHASLLELIQHVPGPDFPTGGIIRGRQGIVDAYRTGRGKLRLRARCEIVEEGRSSHIVVKEVPFQHNRNKLMADIADLVRDERIKDISAIRDESSARNGEPVRLVIELKRTADPHLVLNQLYQYSPLECTVSMILIALVDGRPKVLTLKDIMEEFVRHRMTVIRRRTEYLLREAKRRGHVLEGQLIAISSLDEVINICRSSPNRQEAKVRLIAMTVAAAMLQRALGDEPFHALQSELGVKTAYHMTEQQADAVVRLQLGQLAALERDEIFREFSDIRKDILGWEDLLSDDAKIKDVIRADLRELRDRFGDDRKTEISDEGGRVANIDLIPNVPAVVSISHNGYIKRMPMDTYRAQHRGGKGVSTGAHDDDFMEHFFVASMHSYLLCFTNRGQIYWLRVYEIQESSRASVGRAIANVLSLKPEEKITTVIPVAKFEEGYSLLMATKAGIVKKTALVDYSRPKQGGIIGINLREDDTLIDVCLTKPGDEVLVATRNGQAIRFAQSDAREMGRNTTGVKGIKFKKSDDELIGMVVADPDGYLLTITENGYGKRTPFGPNTADEVEGEEPTTEEVVEVADVTEPTEEGGEVVTASAMRYRRQRRGGSGVCDIKTNERNGKVVRIAAVRDEDDIMLITVQGMVNRTHVDEIRIVGRNTQGVRVMRPKEGDKVVSLAKLARETVDEADVEKVVETAAAVEPAQPE